MDLFQRYLMSQVMAMFYQKHKRGAIDLFYAFDLNPVIKVNSISQKTLRRSIVFHLIILPSVIVFSTLLKYDLSTDL